MAAAEGAKGTEAADCVDLAVIGGGVNGCGIARDAAGRGLRVLLCEQGDLAQGTSSASTGLLHGGLRYLEQGAFRLVRESLRERELLLRAMPHIARPMRFVLPCGGEGGRPAWLLRLGLFIYDHLGGRELLAGTRTLDLRRDPAGEPLRRRDRMAFEYSDCQVDDARLVVLNARAAADLGAMIRTRTRLVAAAREGGLWRLRLEDAESGAARRIAARALVNAGGPWVEEIIRDRLQQAPPARVRLVRGSHIVTRRLFDHDRAYLFQQPDRRVVFAIPWQQDFTLIGTTDIDHEGGPGWAACSPAETAYLCDAVSARFSAPLSPADVVASFAGIRPLCDDGAAPAAAASRDYLLHLSGGAGEPPALHVFGGKITTYRRLAEAALARLRPWFPAMGPAWTAGAPLPGGDFPVDGIGRLVRELRGACPFLDKADALRLVRAYGTEARQVLGGARQAGDLGRAFGAGLSEAELRWLMRREWARTGEDVLWRRSRLGLRITPAEAATLDAWITTARPAAAA